MSRLFVLLALFCVNTVHAQVNFNVNADTLEDDVKAAVHFYESYLNGFKNKSIPDYTQYWPADDCKAYKCPDHTLYAIAGDAPIMGRPTIIYIKPRKDFIQIKTEFGNSDTAGNI